MHQSSCAMLYSPLCKRQLSLNTLLSLSPSSYVPFSVPISLDGTVHSNLPCWLMSSEALPCHCQPLQVMALE